MTAFVVAGVSLGAGLLGGPASADSGPQIPGTAATCLLPLPILCDSSSDDSWSGGQKPDDSWSGGHAPDDSWSGGLAPDESWSKAPVPDDSWSSAPSDNESWSSAPVPQDSWPQKDVPPWRPAGEDEHRVPEGHPETGGGGLAQEPVWPFAVGGAALLTGAGLAGFAVRRRNDVV
ncbi:hypothetical protein AB0I81_07910 [Nonomuraea sp. NPDC050404]|uniref:hypothetical protein n=1 Tax=Nonomuraea sp. NPDC050404 TaxID=3155783 RepID=UPI0033F1AE11